MTSFTAFLLLGGALLISACGGVEDERSGPWKYLPKRNLPTDHSSFFNKPFKSGPEVTKACLECHADAATSMMKTSHWLWKSPENLKIPGREKTVNLGKRNAFNNFCIAVPTNEKMCSKCHIGYGMKDDKFDFTDKTKVDCLACHDTSGTYAKANQGLPAKGVDLLAAAKSVGYTNRGTCGNCHFYGGGGNSVKHGDMSAALFYPADYTDVHMGKNNMVCADCHRAPNHSIKGRAMSVSPSATIKDRIDCTDCHKGDIHQDQRINLHTKKVACQTCHVPFMNREEATKMTWDWSQAGQDLDIKDTHVYMKIKGRFTYEKGAVPEYRWYNKMASHYILGDKIDPTKVTKTDAPIGSRNDGESKIWPFKVHRGKQIYDTVNNYFLVPHLYGENGYWKKFDWDLALKIGSKRTGLAYSGKYGFAPTEMYWPLTHMVAQKEEALDCQSCHGPKGRMNWKALGYKADPIYDTPTRLHEAIKFVDAEGESVVTSGKPISVQKTCASCHEYDDDFLKSHLYHAKVDASQLPAERALLLKAGAQVDKKGDVNCLACHLPNAATKKWQDLLTSKHSAWADSAILANTKLVTLKDESVTYNKDAFNSSGEAVLLLGVDRGMNCAGCHGASASLEIHKEFPRNLNELSWMTITTGQVFSGQRISASPVNISNRDKRNIPWDIHAQRLVKCRDCHYNPQRPERLIGDNVADRLVDSKHSCVTCHDTTKVHKNVKAIERHLEVLSCEACHVPKVQFSAAKQLDYTTLQLDGSPLITWRGTKDGLINNRLTFVESEAPTLATVEGKLTPVNLLSTWRWSDSKGKAVAIATLKQALIDGKNYHADIVKAFDKNGDKHLDQVELRLDTTEKVNAVKSRLVKLGVKDAKISAELRAYKIHHGVQRKAMTKGCAHCHGSDHVKEGKSPKQSIDLANYLPGGVKPTPSKELLEMLPGKLEQEKNTLQFKTNKSVLRLGKEGAN